MCNMSCVLCQVSHVMCQVLCVRKKKKKEKKKIMELVGGGSFINGAYPVYRDASTGVPVVVYVCGHSLRLGMSG